MIDRNLNTESENLNVESEIFGYPRDFYYFLASSLSVFLAVEITRPILPIYLTAMGATTAELGIILGLLSFSLMFTRIPLGAISERTKAIYVIGFAAAGQSLTQLLYGLAPAKSWFYAIRILHAITFACVVPITVALTQLLAPEGKSGQSLGLFLASYGFANTVGPILCASLLTFTNYTSVFLFAALVPILGFIPLLGARDSAAMKKTPEDYIDKSLSNLVDLLRSRNMGLLTLLRLSHSFTYAFFLTLFVVYANNTLLFLPSFIALLFGARAAMDMIIRIPGGSAIDRIDYRWSLMLSYSFLALVYFLISRLIAPLALIFVMMLFGIAYGLRNVSEWTMLMREAGSGNRRIAAAYLGTVFNVGSGSGAVVAGFLATILDIPNIFIIASILLIATTSTIPFIRKKPE